MAWPDAPKVQDEQATRAAPSDCRRTASSLVPHLEQAALRLDALEVTGVEALSEEGGSAPVPQHAQRDRQRSQTC